MSTPLSQAAIYCKLCAEKLIDANFCSEHLIRAVQASEDPALLSKAKQLNAALFAAVEAASGFATECTNRIAASQAPATNLMKPSNN